MDQTIMRSCKTILTLESRVNWLLLLNFMALLLLLQQHSSNATNHTSGHCGKYGFRCVSNKTYQICERKESCDNLNKGQPVYIISEDSPLVTGNCPEETVCDENYAFYCSRLPDKYKTRVSPYKKIINTQAYKTTILPFAKMGNAIKQFKVTSLSNNNKVIKQGELPMNNFIQKPEHNIIQTKQEQGGGLKNTVNNFIHKPEHNIIQTKQEQEGDLKNNELKYGFGDNSKTDETSQMIYFSRFPVFSLTQNANTDDDSKIGFNIPITCKPFTSLKAPTAADIPNYLSVSKSVKCNISSDHEKAFDSGNIMDLSNVTLNNMSVATTELLYTPTKVPELGTIPILSIDPNVSLDFQNDISLYMPPSAHQLLQENETNMNFKICMPAISSMSNKFNFSGAGNFSYNENVTNIDAISTAKTVAYFATKSKLETLTNQPMSNASTVFWRTDSPAYFSTDRKFMDDDDDDVSLLTHPVMCNDSAEIERHVTSTETSTETSTHVKKPKSHVNSSYVCTTEGVFPDPRNASRFFVCEKQGKEFISIPGVCSYKKVFDPRQYDCVYPNSQPETHDKPAELKHHYSSSSGVKHDKGVGKVFKSSSFHRSKVKNNIFIVSADKREQSNCTTTEKIEEENDS